MTSPLSTRAPVLTLRSRRYDVETLTPGSGTIVAEFIPATDPANVTVPAVGARTKAPGFAAKSTPQWPPYRPTGEYSSVIGPFTGATRQTALSAKATNISPPLRTYRLQIQMDRGLELSSEPERNS